jgi:hypothetical protein
MSINRRLVAIISIIIILIAIPLTIYLLRGNLDFRNRAATSGASFSFDPSGGSIVQGGEVEIKILLNSGEKNIIGADSVVSFDRTIFTVVDEDSETDGVQVEAGTFFEKPLVLANKVEGNKLYLSINSFTPFKGAAVFGTIKLQAKKTGTVDLKFVEGETKITEQGTAQNILQTATPGQFKVESSGNSREPSATESASARDINADLNDDGRVNELDLQLFSQKLGTTTGITAFDYNQDKKVDLADFKLFESAFKEQKSAGLTP